MDLKSIINADSSNLPSSRPPPAPPQPPPPRQQHMQSYQGYQQQQSPGPPIPSQQYGGRYDGRPPQPPPIRPPSYPAMGSPSGSISYHSLQSPYGNIPSSASVGGNQYPFPVSDPQSRPLSTQSNNSHFSQRTATGPPPVTQVYVQSAPAPVTPTGGGPTNAYGYPQYQHTPSSQPSYAPSPAQSHMQTYPRDGSSSNHNHNSVQRNTYPPIAQHSQPATPLGPPPAFSRASTMRREGSMSYSYDHQRTQSGSSYGHSPKSAQSSATLERNGSLPLAVSPRGSLSRPPPIQSQSYSSEGNRERSVSVSPKTRLMDLEPPHVAIPMSLGQEQQRRWSKTMDMEPAQPPYHDPYKESRQIQPTPYLQSQGPPPNDGRLSHGANFIPPPSQYDSEHARYQEKQGIAQAHGQFHEPLAPVRVSSHSDRPNPPTLNTQHHPIPRLSHHHSSPLQDILSDRTPVSNVSPTPLASAYIPQATTQPAVATAQTPPATAHSTASFGHSTPQTPISSHRPTMATEVSNPSLRPTPTTHHPVLKREQSTPSTPQTPTAKSPTAQSLLNKKQEHMQHSPRPSDQSEQRPSKRPRLTEAPFWAQKANRGGPNSQRRKNVISKETYSGQASKSTSSAPSTSKPSIPKTTTATNGHPAVKPQQPSLPGSQPPPAIGNKGPLGPLEDSIANIQPFEELTRVISDFLFREIVDRSDIGSVSANGTPIGPAVLEIEAKLGKFIDAGTGQRINHLPILTETVLDSANAGRRVNFKSSMTESQHRAYNTYLNDCVRESHPSAQAQPTNSKKRIAVTYKHTKERDTFYELPAPVETLFPQSIIHHMRHKPKIRITHAKNKDGSIGPILAKIIKCRLADIDIYSPRTKFDWRISVNLEMNWDGDVGELIERATDAHMHANTNANTNNHVNGNAGPLRSREKDRMTYEHCGVYQIDLTQVTPAEATSQADKEHELEVELDAQELKRQGTLLQQEHENRYADLVRGFVDNVRLLVRRGGAREKGE